jgi:hypothetical protein
MDTDILKQIGMSSSGIAIVLVAYRLFKYFKGTMLVSKCCGRKLEVGFDVKDMTTPISINNPMIVDGITSEHNPEREQNQRPKVQTLEV